MPDWEEWDDSVIRLLTVGKNGLEFNVESGTAFAINDNGDYITNHHVIETAIKGGKLVAVESLKPEKLHEVDIVWEAKEHDLAMVHIDTWKKKGLTLSDGSLLSKGRDAVFSIGFPGAADRSNPADFNVATVKRGVFSAFKNFPLTQNGRNIKMLEHDAPVNSGNSGGPLADACGRVVGINEQKALSDLVQNKGGVAVNIAEGILFSINTAELMALLDQHGVAYTRDDSPCLATQTSPTNNFLYLLAVFALLVLVAFVLLHRRIQQLAPEDKANIRTISKAIITGGKSTKSYDNTDPIKKELGDERGGSEDQSENFKSAKQPRSYYCHDRGRIIHRDEQEVKPEQSPSPESPPSPTHIASLYNLVPLRQDLGLPTLSLSKPGNYRLGREASLDNQLVVPNRYVSSEHIVIIVNPDHSVAIEALQTTNGTQVGKIEMMAGEIHSLSVGQVLRLGHDEVIYTLQKG